MLISASSNCKRHRYEVIVYCLLENEIVLKHAPHFVYKCIYIYYIPRTLTQYIIFIFLNVIKYYVFQIL